MIVLSIGLFGDLAKLELYLIAFCVLLHKGKWVKPSTIFKKTIATHNQNNIRLWKRGGANDEGRYIVYTLPFVQMSMLLQPLKCKLHKLAN